MLIAVEGLDGAGKRTLTGALVSAWRAQGLSVAQLAFPRYGMSAHADLAAQALRSPGPVADSPVAMALLFALDRHGAKDQLDELSATHDVLLCDRYVASNAAYGAGRLGEGADGPFAAWVREFEFGRLGLPLPDRQLLLATPAALAAERAKNREAADPGRERDAYERDSSLQERVGVVYRQLAEASWAGLWTILGPEDDPAQLASALL